MGFYALIKTHTVVFVNRFFSSHKAILKAFLLSEKDTLFFDKIQIDFFLEQSKKRDECPVVKDNQPLIKRSNGERKKAVLKYLLSLKPKFLVIQNLYAHLDKNSQKIVNDWLKLAKKETVLIEITNDEKFFLPFIENKMRYDTTENLEPTDRKSMPFKNTACKNYETLVKYTGVSVAYGNKKIFENIHWQIKSNTFWQLIGANGVGKTTLLSLITGDSPKAYGQDIILFDRPIKGQTIWEIKKKIGYCTPDITALFNKRHSVLEMLISGFYDSIGLYQKPSEQQKYTALKWLDFLGLSQLANKTFLSVSMGEQRLILVARAMIKNPPLLILDEPTTGLNPQQKKIVIKLINHFAKHTKSSIIYVSHTIEKYLLPDKIFELQHKNETRIRRFLSH